LPARVELREQLTQESLVLLTAGEVTAATQQQGLLQGTLELPVALLAVAGLIGLGRLDRLPLQAVVSQQGLVAFGERCSLRPRRHCGRKPIRPMQLRHATQLGQGILQPLAEALAALGEADRPRLPVRVGQHEVVQQMVERHALDGYPQAAAVREVAGTQTSWMMHLAEEHLLGRAIKRPPLLDPALQGAELAIGKLAGEATLQVGEQGLGLQTGLKLKHDLQLRPDLGEGIGFGTPVSVHEPDLAGQPAQLAVLACGLGVDAGPSRCLLLVDALPIEAAELADVQIGDHQEPPCLGVRDGVHLLENREI